MRIDPLPDMGVGMQIRIAPKPPASLAGPIVLMLLSLAATIYLLIFGVIRRDPDVPLADSFSVKMFILCGMNFVAFGALILILKTVGPEREVALEASPGRLKVDCWVIGRHHVREYTADDVHVSESIDGIVIWPKTGPFYLASSLDRADRQAIVNLLVVLMRSQHPDANPDAATED